MTITLSEQSERVEKLERLRVLVDDGFAAAYAPAPIATLRHAVASCEAQRQFYADCGFEDAAARE